MGVRQTMFVGCLLAALGVSLGAFGAHALEERLAEAGQTENWRTAVRYQLWHALALLALGLLRRGSAAGGDRTGRLAAWCFLIGTAAFSGSIYLLSLDVGSGVVWPLTPLGGLFLIAGWIAFGLRALGSNS